MGKTALKAAPDEPQATTATIEIPAPRLKLMTVRVVGDTALICHNFGAKAKQQILDKQMKKAKQPKGAKDPEASFQEALYPVPGRKGVYGFPASGFKGAAVSACRFLDGAKMTVARGAFHVVGDILPIDGSPTIREDYVRLQGTTADIRHRAEFKTWSVDLPIRYNSAVISPEQIVNMLNTAGFSVGVGDWRPERDGAFGMFHVESAQQGGV